MTRDGPLYEESDAMAWSAANDSYPFEVRAETFVFGADAATGQDGPVVLEAGDRYVDAESDGATVYYFKQAERRTSGSWTLVWDMVSSDVNQNGRVASGGPGSWAMRLREGTIVPIDEWRAPDSTGVVEL